MAVWNKSYKNSSFSGQNVAGLVGDRIRYTTSVILSSYVDADTTITGLRPAGIANHVATGTLIRNSFTLASLTLIDTLHKTAGIVNSSGMTTIDSCYAAGAVTSSESTLKPLASNIQSAEITNSFWDSTVLATGENQTGATGLATSAMQVACAADSIEGICALGSTAFFFEAGKYPKVKRCVSNCLGTDHDAYVYGEELVGGQDW